VFSKWFPDDPKKEKEQAEIDMQYWKIGSKMIKDEEDL